MENEKIISYLEECVERMRTLKAERKQRRAELIGECERNPRWGDYLSDKNHAANNMKLIKAECGEHSGLTTDIADLSDKIALDEEAIAGCITELIASGHIKNGEAFGGASMTFKPKIKVNLNAQLKLL
mgnify:CR=1 FL=1